MIRLRASSLSDFESCQRRAGARFLQASGLDREFGVQLRRTKQHIGAVVGTGTHAGAAVLMQEFAETGQQGGDHRRKRAMDVAASSVTDQCREPSVMDETTPTNAAAVDAAQKITERIYLDVIPASKPLVIEKGYSATFRGLEGEDEFLVTGTVDLFLVTRDLVDFKTGRNRPKPLAQQGAYSLILRSNGRDVERASIMFGKRPKRGSPADKIEPINLPLSDAERHALSVSRIASRAISDLVSSGDPNVLPANPGCMLCSEKFCPAFNSDFCRVGNLK